LGGELPPHPDNKNIVSRVRRYNGWSAQTGRRVYQPDLRSYKTLVESVEHRAALVAYLER